MALFYICPQSPTMVQSSFVAKPLESIKFHSGAFSGGSLTIIFSATQSDLKV